MKKKLTKPQLVHVCSLFIFSQSVAIYTIYTMELMDMSYDKFVKDLNERYEHSDSDLDSSFADRLRTNDDSDDSDDSSEFDLLRCSDSPLDAIDEKLVIDAKDAKLAKLAKDAKDAPPTSFDVTNGKIDYSFRYEDISYIYRFGKKLYILVHMMTSMICFDYFSEKKADQVFKDITTPHLGSNGTMTFKNYSFRWLDVQYLVKMQTVVKILLGRMGNEPINIYCEDQDESDRLFNFLTRDENTISSRCDTTAFRTVDVCYIWREDNKVHVTLDGDGDGPTITINFDGAEKAIQEYKNILSQMPLK